MNKKIVSALTLGLLAVNVLTVHADDIHGKQQARADRKDKEPVTVICTSVYPFPVLQDYLISHEPHTAGEFYEYSQNGIDWIELAYADYHSDIIGWYSEASCK